MAMDLQTGLDLDWPRRVWFAGLQDRLGAHSVLYTHTACMGQEAMDTRATPCRQFECIQDCHCSIVYTHCSHGQWIHHPEYALAFQTRKQADEANVYND